MPKTLTITDEKVKEAAGKCGTAKEVLKVLFPEAFADEWIVIAKEDLIPRFHQHYDCQYDIHVDWKNPKSGAVYHIGYIKTTPDGKPDFYLDSSRFKVETDTEGMSDRAVLYKFFVKASF